MFELDVDDDKHRYSRQKVLVVQDNTYLLLADAEVRVLETLHVIARAVHFACGDDARVATFRGRPRAATCAARRCCARRRWTASRATT